MKSKNKLNSIYGMTVTNILNTEIEYHDGEYTEKKMTEEEMQEALDIIERLQGDKDYE